MTDPLDLLNDDQRAALTEEDYPHWAQPMLATLVDEPFSDRDWVFERKLDGERCLAFRQGDRIRLLSRNRRPLDNTYPELLSPLGESASDRFVVDGEVVAFDGSLTSFTRLQQRMQIEDRARARRSKVAVYYYLFDILHLHGWSTTGLPLRSRKRLLKALFGYRDPLRYTAHRNTEGESLFRAACERGWEGLIAKDATAPYVHSRSRKWLKFKCVRRQEFVVGGFTEPAGDRPGLGALLIGYYQNGDLVYAGRVGTGFDDDTLRGLADRLTARERRQPPFDRGDLPAHGVHWTSPELVAEVGFTEWTRNGKLRHPRYLGLRRDKAPEEVVRETAQ